MCVYRFMSIVADSGEEGSGQSSHFDFRTLRAARVLRPLKLVTGIPSE